MNIVENNGNLGIPNSDVSPWEDDLIFMKPFFCSKWNSSNSKFIEKVLELGDSNKLKLLFEEKSIENNKSMKLIKYFAN